MHGPHNDAVPTCSQGRVCTGQDAKAERHCGLPGDCAQHLRQRVLLELAKLLRDSTSGGRGRDQRGKSPGAK